MKKGKRDTRYSSFVALPRKMIFGPEWKSLSPGARCLYINLKAKFNGANNGDIKLCYSELMDTAGFRSPKSISSAMQELEGAGWIRRTRYGGLHRFQNRYSLTGQFDDRVD